MQGDVRNAVRMGPPNRPHGTRWDLAIFHPTCTYLCNSGVSRLHRTPPNPSPGVLYGEARWQAMREAAGLFADLLTCGIPRIAVENPVMHGHARRAVELLLGLQLAHLARPAQTIQPYQFGDDASKRTGLWLRGLPPLEIPHEERWIAPRMVCVTCGFVQTPGWAGAACKCADGRELYRPRWANQTDSGQNRLTPGEHRARDRSVTYPGIARAMAEQWGGDARRFQQGER